MKYPEMIGAGVETRQHCAGREIPRDITSRLVVKLNTRYQSKSLRLIRGSEYAGRGVLLLVVAAAAW